jgi:hypothetical protein
MSHAENTLCRNNTLFVRFACWLKVYLKFPEQPVALKRQCESSQRAIDLWAITEMGDARIKHIQYSQHVFLRIGLGTYKPNVTHTIDYQYQFRISRRCFVPVGVDACIADNDVGVGCGIFTDEALTGLHQPNGNTFEKESSRTHVGEKIE